MLHEPASRSFERSLQEETQNGGREPVQQQYDDRLIKIRHWVSQVMLIAAEHTLDELQHAINHTAAKPSAAPAMDPAMAADTNLLITFEGQLKLDSEAAYAQLDEQLATLNLFALFRNTDTPQDLTTPTLPAPHLIYIITGRIKPPPRTWIFNLILFGITLFSVLFVGMQMALAEIRHENIFRYLVLSQNGYQELWRGLPYALSILLILGAHELGHYFAARYHKIAVTLPYFLPFPSGLFGTLGAFIQIREPIRNRKILLDIGAAGPLAGLIFAVPILFIGLATSRIEPPLINGITEGNSLFYAFAKIVVFGRYIPDGTMDVLVNQMAWAGWTGLFVTGLNLLPLGQLDGGHVVYALFGKRARVLFIPIITLLTIIVVLSGGALALLVLLLFFMGRSYAVPLDDITQLDKRRRWVAIATLCIFVLVFVPIPFNYSGIDAARLPVPESGNAYLPLLGALALTVYHRLRR